MASFSSTEAAFEGFRLTREHPMAVAGWVLAYFIFSLALMALVVLSGVGQDVAAAKALSQAPNPDLAEMMQAFERVAPFVAVVVLAQVVFLAVLNCAIYRSVLRPYERGLGYLKLGSDELRMVALAIILFVIWLALIFAVALVATFAAQMAGGLGAVVGGLLALVVGVSSCCAAIWVLVRLSMAAPMTFAERRLVVFGSWPFTHGQTWRLIGAYAVAVVLDFIVILLLGIIFSIVLTLVGTTLSRTGGLNADVGSIRAFLSPSILIAQFLSAIIIVANYVLVLSPFAIAYRGLAGLDTHPEAFA